MGSAMSERSLFDELKQRHVFQVAAIYLAVAWGAVEVLDIVAERLFLPAWLPTLAVIVFLVGFPVAMVLAWTFDIGKGGVRRTATTAGKASLVGALLLMVAGTAGLYYLIRPALFEATGEIDVSAYVPADTSLAVLPFLDISGDDEALVDEFSERLIQAVRTIGSLAVAGRESSFWFKGRGSEPGTVGEMLGVEHVLEGTFRRSGDDLRVSARLLIADTGQTLWSETWEESASALNDVEAAIAERVADSLGTEITESDELSLRDRPRTTVAVQELIARANQEYRKRTREGFERAIELIDQATQLDPDYSPAWIRRTYLELSFLANHQHRPTEEALDIARAALIRAADLGDQSPDFHVATAAILRREGAAYGYTPEREEQLVAALERGVEGQSEAAYVVYAIYERRRGELEHAGELMRALLVQDPLHRVGNMQYNRILMMRGEEERAIEGIKRLVSWYPDYIQAWQELGVFYTRQGRYDKAVAQFERGVRQTTEALPWIYAFNRAWAWLAIGEMNRAAELFVDMGGNRMLGFPGAVVPCTIEGDFERCYEIAQGLVAEMEEPSRYDLADMGWLAMITGRADEAVAWFEQASPDVAGDDPQLNPRSRDAALMLAGALVANGDQERADRLLTRLQPLFTDEAELESVYFHAMRGENDRALEIFEQLVADGWRGANTNTMVAGHGNPLLAPIADDPRFVAAMEIVQSDLAAQRERLPELLRINGVEDQWGQTPLKAQRFW